MSVAVAHILLSKELKQICYIKRERQTCHSIRVRRFVDSSVLKGRSWLSLSRVKLDYLGTFHSIS